MTAPSQPLSILVTGGAGFIGAALVRELAVRGHAVCALDDESSGSFTRLDEDPRTEESRRGSIERVRGAVESALPADLRRFDAIVHLAARVGVAAVVRDPEECRARNVSSTRALARAWSTCARDVRVFAASTSEVYRPSSRPLREDAPVRDRDAVGRWAYAASKLAGEALLDDAWRARGGAVSRGPVHLRFFNVVGPGQDSSQGMVLPTFVEHALASRPLPVHGEGSAVRTLAHVDDVAVTLADLLEHPSVPAGPLNVGGTARGSVRELAELVMRRVAGAPGVARLDPRVVVGPSFEDIPWREPDLTRLRSLGVRVPERDLDAIVRDTVARHVDCMGWRNACASRAS